MSLLSTTLPPEDQPPMSPPSQSSRRQAPEPVFSRRDDPNSSESEEEFFTTDDDDGSSMYGDPSDAGGRRRQQPPPRRGQAQPSGRNRQAARARSPKPPTSRAGRGYAPRRVAQRHPPQAMPPPPPPQPPQFPRCVICKVKPQYRKGLISFTTCGNACATILKARCEICLTKPKNVVNGKTFPTCGITCSKKRREIQSLCSFCKKKPKHIDATTNKTYPHCGRSCRDADLAGVPPPPSAARTLLSSVFSFLSPTSPPEKQAPPPPQNPYTQYPQNPYGPQAQYYQQSGSAGPAPKSPAATQGPLLIDLQRDHNQFTSVSEMFQTDWTRKPNGPPLPRVQKVLKIVQSPNVASRNTQYKAYLNENSPPVSESRRWVAVRYSCQFPAGTGTGPLDPCGQYDCSLCDIVSRNVFNSTDYPGSVPLSGHADRADKQLETKQKVKAMLFTKVISSDEALLTAEEVEASQSNAPRYDVVQLVRFKNERRQLSDKILVYNPDAIAPRFVVLYK